MGDFTQNSKVQISVAGAAVAVVIGAVVWAQTLKHEAEMSDQQIRSEIRELRLSVESLHVLVETQAELAFDSRWRKTDMYAWSARMQLLNPGLVVPDPENANRPYETHTPN